MKPLLLYRWVVAVDDDGDSYIRYVVPTGSPAREFHTGWHYPEGTAKWAEMTCKFFNEWQGNMARNLRKRAPISKERRRKRKALEEMSHLAQKFDVGYNT